MKRALFALIGLVAVMLPVLPAGAAPTIEFLNPSDYSVPLTISDKSDSDAAAHLVAWVGQVPANPLVEFELAPVTMAGATITVDAQRAGTGDAWEAFVSLSSLPDGQYFLRARLYANFTGPGTGEEVAATEETVTVRASAVTEEDTVEILYPDNGGPLGVSTPKGKRSNFVLDAVASEGTEQVRVAYTKSVPGSDPEWTPCGNAEVDAEGAARVRCLLAEGDAALSVTGVAAAANNTPPPATPNDVADATGDAHRVTPYAQVARDVSISPERVVVDPVPPKCQVFTTTTTDQSGRPIAAANVDVHAVGPDDQIRFGVVQRTSSPQATQLTSPFQAPDKSHPSSRPSVDCGNGENSTQRQGDHNIPGANDPQHIESTDGTNSSGRFVFALRSDTVGGTEVVAYSDEDDDDLADATEASGGSAVGWGQEPPQPSLTITLEAPSSSEMTGGCQKVIAVVKRGGNPVPATNLDVHASGPDTTVAFCTPSGGSAARLPDGGTHISGSDDSDTRHIEGETDALGAFTFGVTSATEGTTQVVAWIDTFEDDLQASNEPSASADLQWASSGQRSISISSNKSSVPRGRGVTISGDIEGSSGCEQVQQVKLQRKRLNGPRFRTFMTATTDSAGHYSARVAVNASRRYRAVAPTAGICVKAVSRTITVRAT